MFGHADETDDTHPPSLTIRDERRTGGARHRRTASPAGAGAAARDRPRLRYLLAHAAHAQTYALPAFGHHAAATGQLFGAAATAGALLNLSAQQIRFTLSYAGQQTAGLYTMFRDPEHIEKAYAMGGMPAHNGTQAALMAAHGWTGVEDIFSGERDFFFTFAPEEVDRNEMVRGLGREYEIMRAGIKRWPVGGPIQGPMHVLRDLILEHKLNAGDVTQIIARMPDKELEIVNNRASPDISVQHLLSIMLIDGNITFKSAHDFARMKDPAVLKVRRLVQAIGDAALTDAQRRWRCVMELRLKDGRVLRHQTMAAKGSFENPLTPDEENEKALDLIQPVLGRKRSAALLQALWNFDKITDVRTLRKLYCA
jgi:2-methylcitrate dehydratase PrpD